MTRTEFSIRVTNADGRQWELVPINQGAEDITRERLRDLQAVPAGVPEEEGQIFELIKREVTIGEWEVTT